MQEFERLTYTNESGERIEFSVRSPFHVNMKDVGGLSETKNTVHQVPIMGRDGNLYLGSQLDSRRVEVVGRFRPRDKETVLSLRRELVHGCTPKQTGELVYEMGEHRRTLACEIDQPPAFSRKGLFEQFTIQILGSSPFWQDGVEHVSRIEAWTGAFEFPEPYGLEITEAGIEFGSYNGEREMSIYNEGDVETGMRIVMKARGPVDTPMITHVETGERIVFHMMLSAGDQIEVNTRPGEKAVAITQKGITRNGIHLWPMDNAFLSLHAGSNTLVAGAKQNPEALDVAFYYGFLYSGV